MYKESQFKILLLLYSGGQFYWCRKPAYLEKTTDLPEVTDKMCNTRLYRGHLERAGFELTTLVVIVTDCKDICISNYYTITTVPIYYNTTASMG
jgi:hypothetical protein